MICLYPVQGSWNTRNMWSFVFCQNWRNSVLNIGSYFLPLPLSFFPRKPVTYILDLLILFHRSPILFFLYYYFLFASLQITTDLSDLLIFSFVMFNTSAKPFQRFHILYFSVLKLKFLLKFSMSIIFIFFFVLYFTFIGFFKVVFC